MECEICHQTGKGLLYVLPIPQKDGKLNTITCEECARKTTAFCHKHDCSHQGFTDGTTACLRCIEELVQEYTPDADAIFDKLDIILHATNQRGYRVQIEVLHEFAGIASTTTGTSENISTLRFIATKAMRTGQTIDQVIEQIEKNDDGVYYILT